MSSRSDSTVGPPAEPTGVLLVQLGTPAAPTPREVRRLLRAFLGDPRVVEANPFVWRLVLESIVLPRRARTSAAAYAKIWTPAGSPLLVNTRAQAEALSQSAGSFARVRFAMTYGQPAIGGELDALVAEGCRQIRVLPLFPQYSNTTTGSVYAAVAAWIATRRNPPAIELLPSFPTHPAYIETLAEGIETTLAPRKGTEHFLFSFHGLPQAYIERGDPYLRECESTARALAQRLNLIDRNWSISWQSRFGRQPWLSPSTEERALDLTRSTTPLVIVTPGFVADCLETLEEIGIRLRERCRAMNGRDFLLVPCANSSPSWIRALRDLID